MIPFFRILLITFITTACGTLYAQSPEPLDLSGFNLRAGLGYYFNNNSPSFDRSYSPASIELNYERVAGNRLSLHLGLGLQYREQQIVTMDEFIPYIPGNVVINMTNSESYRTHESDVYARIGIGYRIGRLQLQATLLPSYRFHDRINYRYVNGFSAPGRPDQVINQTVRSGETVDRRDLFLTPRTIRTTGRYALNIGLGAQYKLTGKWSIGVEIRPVLTDFDLEATDHTFCTDTFCADTDGQARTIASLRGTSALLQIGYHF